MQLFVTLSHINVRIFRAMIPGITVSDPQEIPRSDAELQANSRPVGTG